LEVLGKTGWTVGILKLMRGFWGGEALDEAQAGGPDTCIRTGEELTERGETSGIVKDLISGNTQNERGGNQEGDPNLE